MNSFINIGKNNKTYFLRKTLKGKNITRWCDEENDYSCGFISYFFGGNLLTLRFLKWIGKSKVKGYVPKFLGCMMFA